MANFRISKETAFFWHICLFLHQLPKTAEIEVISFCFIFCKGKWQHLSYEERICWILNKNTWSLELFLMWIDLIPVPKKRYEYAVFLLIVFIAPARWLGWGTTAESYKSHSIKEQSFVPNKIRDPWVRLSYKACLRFSPCAHGVMFIFFFWDIQGTVSEGWVENFVCKWSAWCWNIHLKSGEERI